MGRICHTVSLTPSAGRPRTPQHRRRRSASAAAHHPLHAAIQPGDAAKGAQREVRVGLRRPLALSANLVVQEGLESVKQREVPSTVLLAHVLRPATQKTEQDVEELSATGALRERQGVREWRRRRLSSKARSNVCDLHVTRAVRRRNRHDALVATCATHAAGVRGRIASQHLPVGVFFLPSVLGTGA